MINRVEVIKKYRYEGKEYFALADICKDVHNGIGAMVNSFDITLTPRQKLNIYEALIEKRKELVKLLSVEVDMDDDSLQGDVRDLLSIKL